MASGPGRVLRPVSRVQTNNLPGETVARSCAVHRGSLVPPVRKDPLCCSAVALVVSPEQRIQRSRIGPGCPPIQDHHPKNYWISFKTAEIRGVEAAQDKDRVLQRKQNPSLPEQSRNNPGRAWSQHTLLLASLDSDSEA